MSKTESNTYAVSKTVRHTLNPAGRLRRISAALVVDDVAETKMVNGKDDTNPSQANRRRTQRD